MTLQDVVAVVREFGFPTFFCLWLMFRAERALKALTDQQTKMLVVLSVLARSVDVHDDDVAAVVTAPSMRSSRLDHTGAFKKLPVGKEEVLP